MNINNIKYILISLFVITFVAVFPHTGYFSFFSFSYTIPVMLLILIYLKLCKETFSDIGFRFKSINIHTIIVGGIVAVTAFLFLQFIFFTILESFFTFEKIQVNLYISLRYGSFIFYIFILVMSWIVGGIYEEIVFHGFIFSRIEKMFNNKHKTSISFLTTSIIFGLYHYHLGVLDTINALLLGAVYLGLFLYFKRNLWYSVFCHGFYNTIVITLLYLGYI